jgi:hypothetical protein
VANAADVTTDPQTLLLTLPSSATSVVNGETVDNRGTWNASINSTADNGVRAIAYFSVADPSAAAADLAIYADNTSLDTLQPGQATGFSVWLNNIGPNAAQAVHVTQSVPPNMTFASATPGTGPAFTCSESGGVVDCAPAQSLASGAIATFTINYTVSAGAPNTIINSEIDITSATTDPRPASNSSTVKVEIRTAGTAPATCSMDCPSNVTVTADTTQNNVLGAVVNFAGGISSSGDCGTINTSPASGSFFPVGTTTVSVLSSDGGGSCSFIVTVLDTAPPTITCPTNIGVQAADGACDATVDVGAPATTGSGVTVSSTRSDGEAIDAPYPGGTTTITWTATDSNGRTATCTQTVTVTVNDTIAPTITAPPDVNTTTPLGAAGSCGVVVSEADLGSPTTDDNCSASVKVTRTGVPTGNFFPTGTTAITYTAKDSAGNTATAIQHVTVTDRTLPLIAAPPDATYTCLSEVPAANPSQATSGTILDDNGNPLPPQPPSDNCGTPTVTVSETRSGAGSAASPLVIKRTFTATDAAGNFASSIQTITVTDATPPTITAPADKVLHTDAGATSCGVTVSDLDGTLGTASASDNCAGVTVARSGVPSGNIFPVGDTIVTYTATDAVGNPATATQKVTVIDNTAPVVTPPAAVTLYTGAGANSCGVSVSNLDATLGTGSATDNCSGAGAVTRSGVPSGSIFPLGTTTITYSATDAAGNVGTATQVVTVVDNTPPVVTAPANITVGNDAGSCTAMLNPGTATATDNCAGVSTPTGVRSDGQALNAAYPKGTTTITWTATDAAGNPATAQQTVTVNDTEKPVLHVPADIVVGNDVGSCSALVSFNVTATDNCGSVNVTTSVPSGTSFPKGTTTVTATATDSSGNTSTASFHVTVNDTEKPVVNVPANIVVNLPANSTATSMNVSYAVTATDNCPGVTFSVNPVSGSVFPVGTTIVTATATDAAGNVTTRTFTVTVLYNFTGFFSPVSNLPTLNQVNAGRAIPVKFSLSGNKGLNIFLVGSPDSQQIACDTGAPLSDLQDTVNAGGSSLSYDAGSDQYNYVWKTDGAWAGTCRQLVLGLKDGSPRYARFKFK